MCTHILGYNLTILQGKHQYFLKLNWGINWSNLPNVMSLTQCPPSPRAHAPPSKPPHLAWCCSSVTTQQFRKQSRKSGHDGTIEKTLSSPPLISTPKWQLSAEQPSMTKIGPTRKGLLQLKTQRRNHSERGRRGGFTIYWNHMWRLGGWPTSWRIILQRFSHRSKSSETHVRLSSPGFWHWEDELPEHLAL